MESGKRIMRNDIILILTFLVIALIAFIFTLIPRPSGESVSVSLGGETVGSYSLSDEVHVPIKNENGETLLILNIEGGKVTVTESVCIDHSCERMGPIGRSGESIICLVSKVVIKVDGGTSFVDAVAFNKKEEVLL